MATSHGPQPVGEHVCCFAFELQLIEPWKPAVVDDTSRCSESNEHELQQMEQQVAQLREQVNRWLDLGTYRHAPARSRVRVCTCVRGSVFGSGDTMQLCNYTWPFLNRRIYRIAACGMHRYA